MIPDFKTLSFIKHLLCTTFYTLILYALYYFILIVAQEKVIHFFKLQLMK